MKIQNSMSPNLIKVVIVGAAMIGVLTLWNGLKSRIVNWGYEPVYGQQNHEPVVPVREELYSLPIVIAKNDDNPDSTNSQITDADIEAAFRVPAPAVEEVAEVEPELSLSQSFLSLYRPVVNAISGDGAFINGQFWSIGESVVAMPIRSRDGQLFVPVVYGVRSGVVSLKAGDEVINLPFKGY
ncbi:hypothetical protein VQ574_21245 (plasmid) [Stutzerimonas frequens]|uniref:hypothetical protein n=1 Tax=Stutzerimonas frequens TaxID=2968969 RepID=UPI002DB70477|nr:hypothetical protein [Stutzerimonas frequens]WRW29466.1 hypothetical protein VQ574_21245 [Stutzerimonas frequens]